MTTTALDELLRHGAALRSLARDLVGASWADDLLQDAALQAITAPPPRPGPLAGWLATVVRGLAGKHRRAERLRAVRERQAARAEALPADRSAADADTLHALTACIAALPEPFRGTLLARYLREQSPLAIAREAGVPVRTVKTRLQRGLRLLRQRLDERDTEWRPLLVLTFGIDRNVAPTVAASAPAGLALPIAAASLLLGTVGAWSFVGSGTVPAAATEIAAAPASIASDASGVRAAPPAADARVDMSPTARAAAVVDAVVVRAIDATTGSPIERFALRESSAPDLNMLQAEAQLRWDEVHPGGELVLAAADLEQRAFQLEVATPGWLPSPWFVLADAVARDGRRTIEVRLAAPIAVDLDVVREHGGAPVAGTRVEVLRPWRGTSAVALNTMAVAPQRFRVPLEEPAQVVAMLGGRAIVLASGTTDAAGRVRLSVPADEALALRLLGPGHRPVVRNGWRVLASPVPAHCVETVGSGGAIQGRVIPLATLQQLSVALPTTSPQMARNMAIYGTGLKLRNTQTNATIPAGTMLGLAAPVPFAADGSFAIDGLQAGDWEVMFSYGLRIQPGTGSPFEGLTTVQVVLPPVTNLADGELRVFDIDVSGWAPGHLRATISRAGSAVPGEGALVAFPVAALEAPMPVMTAQLPRDPAGFVVADLPPGRYAARWLEQHGRSFELPAFEIRTGATTQVDLAIDAVAAGFRVLEVDGATPAVGTLQLQHEGAMWQAQRQLDGVGECSFEELPRGTRLRAHFYRPAASGLVTLTPPQPIDLGEIDVGDGWTATRQLRLPAR